MKAPTVKKHSNQPCLLFNHAFLEQMPDDIRLLLMGEDVADPLQLVELADELWQ